MSEEIRHAVSKSTGHRDDLAPVKIRRLGSGKAMTQHPAALPLRYATIHNTKTTYVPLITIYRKHKA